MDNIDINYHVNQIASALGFAEPVGFMLSYEVGDIWIDIYMDKDERGWENKTYTISVPRSRGEKLRGFLQKIKGDTSNMIQDQDRVYASLSQEDWELLSPSLMNLL